MSEAAYTRETGPDCYLLGAVEHDGSKGCVVDVYRMEDVIKALGDVELTWENIWYYGPQHGLEHFERIRARSPFAAEHNAALFVTSRGGRIWDEDQ